MTLATVAVAVGCEPAPRPAAATVDGVKVCGPIASPHAELVQRIDRALASAARFLESKQSPDGLWRSNVYGTFKEGDALAPFVMRALAALPEQVDRDETDALRVLTLGTNALAKLIDQSMLSDRQPLPELTYSVYSAANALVALTAMLDEATLEGVPRTPEQWKFLLDTRSAWVSYLRARQLTEDLGWSPDDPEYGGWSYSPEPVRKPPANQPLGTLAQPNLSATAFAVDALRAAGCKADDPALPPALRFIECCQNYEPDAARRDAAYDDGGFFFIHDDPVRNKAGSIGVDRSGRQRFASYGSTTADGLRAMLACGATRDNPRVQAALQWIEGHFSTAGHPGKFPQDRELMRDSLTFYYWYALSDALHAARVRQFDHTREYFLWAEVVARQLLERQQSDGSWRNAAVDVREDDPLVATPLAVMALINCRRVLLEPRPAASQN